MVELLYGCGLRVGELEGLDVAPAPTPSAWARLDRSAAAEVHNVRQRQQAPQPALGAAALRAPRPGWRSAPRRFAPGGWTLRCSWASAARLSAQSIWLRLRQRSQLRQAEHAGAPRTCCATLISPATCCKVSDDLRAVQGCWGTPASPPRRSIPGWTIQHLAKVYDQAHHGRAQITRRPGAGAKVGSPSVWLPAAMFASQLRRRCIALLAMLAARI